jgi:hypothetical protein
MAGAPGKPHDHGDQDRQADRLVQVERVYSGADWHFGYVLHPPAKCDLAYDRHRNKPVEHDCRRRVAVWPTRV